MTGQNSEFAPSLLHLQRRRRLILFDFDNQIPFEIGIGFVLVAARIAEHARFADHVVEGIVGMAVNPTCRPILFDEPLQTLHVNTKGAFSQLVGDATRAR